MQLSVSGDKEVMKMKVKKKTTKKKQEISAMELPTVMYEVGGSDMNQGISRSLMVKAHTVERAYDHFRVLIKDLKIGG